MLIALGGVMIEEKASVLSTTSVIV